MEGSTQNRLLVCVVGPSNRNKNTNSMLLLGPLALPGTMWSAWESLGRLAGWASTQCFYHIRCWEEFSVGGRVADPRTTLWELAQITFLNPSPAVRYHPIYVTGEETEARRRGSSSSSLHKCGQVLPLLRPPWRWPCPVGVFSWPNRIFSI